MLYDVVDNDGDAMVDGFSDVVIVAVTVSILVMVAKSLTIIRCQLPKNNTPPSLSITPTTVAPSPPAVRKPSVKPKSHKDLWLEEKRQVSVWCCVVCTVQ